jgi:hypothetical protein
MKNSIALDLYIGGDKEYMAILLGSDKADDEAVLAAIKSKPWHKRTGKITDEARNICALFGSLLKNQDDIPSMYWWQIFCSPFVNRLPVIDGRHITQTIDFDMFHFETLTDYEKKKMLLDTIMKAAYSMQENAGWNMKPFKAVEKEIIALDYRNEYYHKENLNNRNRRFTVSMFCIHEMRYMDISLILRNKQSAELVRVPLAHTDPDEWDFYQYLGKLSWSSDSTVRLRYKGYRGHDWLFNDDDESGLLIDFANAIAKYEAGDSESITGNDVVIHKLFGEKRILLEVENKLKEADLLWRNMQRDEAAKIYTEHYEELSEARLGKLKRWKRKEIVALKKKLCG